jgi:hypothetical protein
MVGLAMEGYWPVDASKNAQILIKQQAGEDIVAMGVILICVKVVFKNFRVQIL